MSSLSPTVRHLDTVQLKNHLAGEEILFFLSKDNCHLIQALSSKSAVSSFGFVKDGGLLRRKKDPSPASCCGIVVRVLWCEVFRKNATNVLEFDTDLHEGIFGWI